VTEIVAIPLALEGALAVISSFILFVGTVWLLLAAVVGVRMGYLLTAVGFFGFMIVLSFMWAFGAPGTPRFLGPKGDLPTWVPVEAGVALESRTYPVLGEYPGGKWQDPAGDDALAAEVDPAALAFAEFLAERATEELHAAGIDAEISPEDFDVHDVRFTEVDGTRLAAARAFSTTGGPEVVVFGYRDPGDEGFPSFAFLIASILGFVAHLPFLDRAERRRKEILTGGDQAAWRGPA
jgi:hypothetical protein